MGATFKHVGHVPYGWNLNISPTASYCLSLISKYIVSTLFSYGIGMFLPLTL
jgi:hypothetical protein